MNIEINDESGFTEAGSDEDDSPASVDVTNLMQLCRFVLTELRMHPQCELSVKLVDEQTMAVYHQEFLGLSGPTDVMSWPMDELRPGTERRESDPGHLGDVALCPSVAAKQASAQGSATAEELELLTVHGILHLLGYDHAEPEQKAAMWQVQTNLLTAWRDDPVDGTDADDFDGVEAAEAEAGDDPVAHSDDGSERRDDA